MSLQKEAAYVDGFVDCLRDNGVSVDNFVKQASQSQDPSLQKIASAIVDLAQRRAQQGEGQTKEAMPWKAVAGKFRKGLEDAGKSIGGAIRGNVNQKGGQGLVSRLRQGVGERIYQNPKSLGVAGTTRGEAAAGAAGLGAGAAGGYGMAPEQDPGLSKQYIGI